MILKHSLSNLEHPSGHSHSSECGQLLSGGVKITDGTIPEPKNPHRITPGSVSMQRLPPLRNIVLFLKIK